MADEQKKPDSGRPPARRRKLSANLITLFDPKAPASEAYRSLRTNIGYAGIDRQIKTICVTSPGPGEGKSTTCANLAVSLAQTGNRVLLMEADLRKPKIHKYFAMPNDNGVTNILKGDIPFITAIKTLPEIRNLHLMCSGPLPPNPSEMLESQKMETLLAEAREEYDYVIVDTPPAGQLTDGAVVGRLVDGVILVVASGESNIDMARHARDNLNNVGANIMGTVVSKIDRHSGGAYYNRYYNYDRYYYEE